MHEKLPSSDTHSEKQPGSSLESDPDLQAIRDAFDTDMAKMQSIDTSFSDKDHATQKQEDLKSARDEVNALYGETNDQPQSTEYDMGSTVQVYRNPRDGKDGYMQGGWRVTGKYADGRLRVQSTETIDGQEMQLTKTVTPDMLDSWRGGDESQDTENKLRQPETAKTPPTVQPGSAEGVAWQTAGDRPGRRVIVDPTLEGASLEGISLGGRETPTQNPDRFNLEEHDQRYRPDAPMYFASTPDEDPTEKEPADGALAAAEAAIQQHTEKQQDGQSGEKPADVVVETTDNIQQETNGDEAPFDPKGALYKELQNEYRKVNQWIQYAGDRGPIQMREEVGRMGKSIDSLLEENPDDKGLLAARTVFSHIKSDTTPGQLQRILRDAGKHIRGSE